MSVPDFLSVAEYAEILRVSPTTVRRLIRDKDLAAEQLGGKVWRIPVAALPESVRAALAARYAAAPAA